MYLFWHDTPGGGLDGVDHVLLDQAQCSRQVLLEPGQVDLRLLIVGLHV